MKQIPHLYLQTTLFLHSHIRDHTHFQDKKNKDVTKKDAIAHFHMRLDFNISRSRDFKYFNFELV